MYHLTVVSKMGINAVESRFAKRKCWLLYEVKPTRVYMFNGLQVIDMPEHNPGQMGGTMRLGKRRTIFKSNTSVLSEDQPHVL